MNALAFTQFLRVSNSKKYPIPVDINPVVDAYTFDMCSAGISQLEKEEIPAGIKC